MPNITIYLPADVERDVRRAVKKDRTTMSRFITDLILDRLKSGPAPGVVNAIGAIPDFPSFEELRSGYAQDTDRESL